MHPKADKSKKNILTEKNIFLINQLYIGGESGNFFDYFFGMYGEELVLNLIYLIKDIGKLIDNVKYFTSDNLSILEDYIICKYNMNKNNLEFNESEKTSL